MSPTVEFAPIDSYTYIFVLYSRLVRNIAVSAYTFHGLSGADFEALVRDLLRASMDTSFQIFTAGRDNGIDLMLGARRSKAMVVQCKHYRKSGYTKLRSDLVNHEISKLKKLKPRRYILATSVGLTPGNKEELVDLLAPHCAGMQDILGCDDLNALLRDHPNVETSHHKLWLTSTAVLQRIVRHGAAVWRGMTLEDVERKMSVYVQTKAYGRALQILDEHNYCVISGIPGIGKTTIAEMLIARLLNEEYEVVCVRSDIQEAFNELDPAKRQIVYYDDFLGRTSHGERLGKNEDRGIMRLLEAARRSKTLKVVFTTREYILADAQHRHEPLNGPELNVSKCVVKLEDYKRGHKARILYNHLYFSTLTPAHVNALRHEKTYRRIIDHENYNPRLVNWMTSEMGVRGIKPSDFVDEFMSTLNHPERMWGHVFDNQISTDARMVLLTLATVTSLMDLNDLRQAWACSLNRDGSGIATREERERFIQAVKQLDGSMLRLQPTEQIVAVEFHDASIRDFVSARLAGDDALRRDFLESARYFEQVWTLAHMSRKGRVDHTTRTPLPDSPELRAALLRTWETPTPLCWSMRNMSPMKENTDLGDRLALLVQWAQRMGSEPFMDWVCGLAERSLTSNSQKRLVTMRATRALSILVNNWPSVAQRHAAMIKMLANLLGRRVRSARDPDDWLTWGELVTSTPALFDDSARDEWAIDAEHFCIDECEYLVKDQEDWAEAEDRLERLDKIAECWDFTYESNRTEVEDMIECQQREAEKDNDSGYLCKDDGDVIDDDSVGNSDAEIDGLFECLDPPDDSA